MTEHNQNDLHQQVNDHESAPAVAAISVRHALVGAAVLLTGAGLLAGFGIYGRHQHDVVLAGHTRELAAPTVSVAPARAGMPVAQLTLPGNVTAYTDAPLYARTSGYLTRWYFDIGARVRKGQLIAEIASPEVDRQLQQAQADLATAQANAANYRAQADRYAGLVSSSAVSRQDAETLAAQANASAATVASAQANLARLRELQSFEKIYAPFDGVLTARNVDNGQLVDAGASHELFRLQAVQTLRVYTNVPQFYSASLKQGETFDVTFAEHPGQTYAGHLVRTADAIDPVSRTLLVELDLDNRNGQLLPGSLAQVHFHVAKPAATVVVPTAAMLFRHEGLRVAVAVQTPSGTVARLVPVVMAEDDGSTVQLLAGIQSTDQVIQDPPDSILDNEPVRVVAGGR